MALAMDCNNRTYEDNQYYYRRDDTTQVHCIAFHSVLNKITGVCLFVLPLSLCVTDIKYSGSVICVIAMVATLQEFITVITKDWTSN